MCSLGINEGELRGQPANLGSPGKMAVKMECVTVCMHVIQLIEMSVSCEEQYAVAFTTIVG